MGGHRKGSHRDSNLAVALPILLVVQAPLSPGFSSLLPWALGSFTSGSHSGLTIPVANQPHKLHPTSPGPSAGGMDLSCQTQAGSGAHGGAHRENGGGETPWGRL